MRKLALVGFLLLASSIVLAGCGGKETPAPTLTPTATPTDAQAEISISGFAFVPETLQVSVGTKVRWTNNDSVTHTVTSRDDLFDSGDLPSGGTFSYTFDQSGTFEYYCTIHPFMTAKIVVK